MKEKPKNVVPANAVTERNGGKVVFVINEGGREAGAGQARPAVRQRLRAASKAPPPGRASSPTPRPSCPTGSESKKRAADGDMTSDKQSTRTKKTADRQRAKPIVELARRHQDLLPRQGAAPRPRRHRPRHPRGRVRGADGPVGLRQVDAAQPHRRPRSPDDAARRRSPATTSRTMSDGDLAKFRSQTRSASSSRPTT